MLLAAYFLLRRFALKTLIGGYDDSLIPAEGWLALCQQWWHSLQVLFFPVNTDIISPNFLAIQAWQVFLLGCVVATIAQSFRSSATLRMALFILSWWAISLLPVFKLFILTDSLQGTRMAYMCSVPLSIGLTFGIAVLARSPVNRSLAMLWISGFLVTAFLLLAKYNEPWAQSGSEIRTIVTALNRFYKSHPDDHSVHFVGIPQQIQGAFAGPSGSTLLEKPQLFKDVRFGKIVNSADRLMPFGFLRRSIEATETTSEVYRWDNYKEDFTRFRVANERPQKKETYTSSALTNLVSPSCLVNGSTKIESDGIVYLSGASSPPLELEFNRHAISGWDAQILRLKILVLDAASHKEAALTWLGFTNDLQVKPERDISAVASILPTANPQVLTIPMRGNIAWSLGGYCNKLALYLPQGWQVKLLELSSDDDKQCVPQIGMNHGTCPEQNGYILLTPSIKTCDLSFDVRNVKAARSASIEITRPNAVFPAANAAYPSPYTGKSILLNKTFGLAHLTDKDFPDYGIYQLRVVGNDLAGRRVGLASDHMVVVKPLLPDRSRPADRLASSNLTK